MSSDSLAVFRKGLGPDLNALADKHMQHEYDGSSVEVGRYSKNADADDLRSLQQSDRDALRKAASTVKMHTTIGSIVGLSLGVLLAFRIRSSRQKLYTAFRTAEKPQAVRFADGREEVLPDISGAVKPSRIGDLATYTLLGAGGIFFGGETGLLTGSFRARSMITQDRESSTRIQNAFKRFQADALREQANLLEQSIH